MSPKKLASGLLVFAVTAFLAGSAAEAQNLDQGKPAPKLFSESCVSCHRSPRGLAKGRFKLTLYLFLQKHYVSGSGSAWALASYLKSVDSAQARPIARRGEAIGCDDGHGTVVLPSAGIGTGAVGPARLRHGLLTATLRNLPAADIFSTFAWLPSAVVCVAGSNDHGGGD